MALISKDTTKDTRAIANLFIIIPKSFLNHSKWPEKPKYRKSEPSVRGVRL